MTLQKTNDLGGIWATLNIGAGSSTGGDGLTAVFPDVEGSPAFFRLVTP